MKEGPQPDRRSSRLSLWVTATGFGLFFLLLHFLLKDRLALLAPLYYIYPFPLIGVFFFPLLVRAVKRKTWSTVAIAMVAVLFAPLVHFSGYIASLAGTPGQASGPADLRVLLWTPDHYEYCSLEQAFSFLSSLETDIIALVEGNVDYGTQERLAERLFPDRTMELLPHGMLIIHRGKLLEQESLMVDGGKGALTRCTLEINGRRIRLGIYDQESSPLYSRSKSLKELALYMRPRADEPSLLAGDFNIPHTAASLRHLGDFMQSSTSVIQGGVPYTWPEFLPFLAFDQVWFSRGLEADRATTITTGLAWHKAVLVEFNFR